MKKEGLHYLAYSLTLDPAEEILGALEGVVKKQLRELPSLDEILEVKPSEQTIEAEVKDTPVYATAAGARYQTDTVVLPENYSQTPYNKDSEEDTEVVHKIDDRWQNSAAVYEEEISKQIQARVWKMTHAEMYPTAEAAERVENYKITLGYAMRFLLYSIKTIAS